MAKPPVSQVFSMLLLRCLAAAALALPLAATAATVVMNEPGYLVVDGSYYVFDQPILDSVRQPIELHPRGEEGFYLRSLVAMGACRVDESAGAPPQSPAGLRHAELLDLIEAPRFDLRLAEGETVARMRMVACDGAVVMFAQTTSGLTACAGAIPFPFRRGQCTAVDSNDPGLVFFNAFEP
jgi:hypothetical protein